MELKEFDPKAKCPKCGHESVRTWYCSEPKYSYICFPGRQYYGIPKEHLHRSCERCHYEWLEKCIKKGVSHKNVSSGTRVLEMPEADLPGVL